MMACVALNYVCSCELSVRHPTSCQKTMFLSPSFLSGDK